MASLSPAKQHEIGTTGESYCPSCGSAAAKSFFRQHEVPVNACVQWPTRDSAAACPRGDIDLVFCRQCGLIFNAAFDAALLAYGQSYDNALHHSSVFAAYADELAGELVETYGIRGKDVVEIGCGDGAFLRTICRAGQNRGAGFDPSYVPTGQPDDGRVRIVSEYYSEQFAEEPADLICCRQVFEHIPEPHAFLSMLRRVIGRRLGCTVMFEVPNTLYPLRDRSIWDIIYEHCSYFTAPSLSAAFTLAGFDVLRVRETFSGQYLVIEARISSEANAAVDAPLPNGNGIGELAHLVDGFSTYYQQRVQSWRSRLRGFAAAGARTVLWGGGARGVSFLNALSPAQEVSCAVDVNPRKHGTFLPGTGQPVVPPDFLKEHRPDHVIVMNPVYESEIRSSLAAMGLEPAVHLA